MSAHRRSPQASRRNFLKGAGLVGAAAAVAPSAPANAMQAIQSEKSIAALPGPRQIAAETMPPPSDPVNQTSSGGDFMTDVLNSLGIEYMAINCASSYRGLHEAIINHGGNKPEIITCVHEDIAVHMRKATPRSKVSRLRWRVTARSVCNTPRWRCTTLGAIARRSSCSAAI